jgi:ABC-type multidrug transport system fused ATPase/permease subunit
LLEAVVVLVSCASAWLPGLDAAGAAWVQVITVLRALRLMRVARIVSRVRIFHEVWLLLRGLAGSMRVLFWTLVVIFVITYMFAVFGVVLISLDIEDAYHEMLFEKEQAMKNFTGYADCSAAASDALAWKPSKPEFDQVAILYESTRGIWQWIFTLLQVLTLDSWMSIARPMQDIVELSWVFFYLYIAIVVFVLMNLVTAIIVDNALKRSREDEKEVRQQKKKEQKKALKLCRRLFNDIDEDGDETLTLQELKNACNDPYLGRQLQVLDISSENADEVFKMMDAGSDGVSLDEFFDGTKRLQGPAEGRDMVRTLAIMTKLSKGVREQLGPGMSSASLPSHHQSRHCPYRVPPGELADRLDIVCKAVSLLESKVDMLDNSVITV